MDQIEPGIDPRELVRTSDAEALIARRTEVEVAERMLGMVRAGRGRLLMLEGAPGTGKTRMIDAVVERAGGLRRLRAACSPLEQRNRFGLLCDLLEPAFGPLEATLTGDPGTVSRRAVDLLAQVTDHGPAILAIDDLHWADEPSLRWLVHVCARLPELPMLVVLAWRSGAGAAQLVELFRSYGERIPLATLSPAAVGELRAAASEGAGAEVSAEVGRRLSAFGGDAMDFAQAVAVLGEYAQLRTAAALAEVEFAHGARHADELVAAGLLRAATPPSFPDRVVRDAVYGAIADGRRALMHAAAARALAADGAPDEIVAEHLLRAEPAEDFSAVALLRRLADRARSRGDRADAVRLLRRALAELQSAGERASILVRLGALEARAGLADAQGHLLQAASTGTPGERAAATVELADLELLSGRSREAIRLLEAGLADASTVVGEEAGLSLRAELAAAVLLAAAPSVEGSTDMLASLPRGVSRGERALLVLAAASAALAGEPLAGRAGELGRGLTEERLRLPPAAALAALWGLQTAEDLPVVERLIESELLAGGPAGCGAREAVASVVRARLHLTHGDLRLAEADARRALAVSRASGHELPATLALSVLVEALVDQGRLLDAERELGADSIAEAAPDDFARCMLACARGRLHAASGEAHLGMRDVLAAGARLLRCGWATPSFGWRSCAGLLAHRLDRHEEARRLIDDEYALARRVGAPRPTGVALRAMALIGRDSQIELLGEAADHLRRSPARLELARTLCDLGAALRRSNFRASAREPLHEALQLAHECGARALSERARRELLVLGARPRRYAVTGVEALTTREREAGELAARGMTNRQIAEAMSVTPNTVEYHLTNVFRKLGIGGREALSGTLNPDRVAPRGSGHSGGGGQGSRLS